MLRIHYMLILALMAANYSSFAQREGYNVMVKDTTYIQGYLNYSAEDLNVESIGYAKLRRSNFIYFKPDELVEYGLNGEVLVSKDVDQQSKFLRQLMPGDQSLYLTRLVFVWKEELTIPFKHLSC